MKYWKLIIFTLTAAFAAFTNADDKNEPQDPRIKLITDYVLKGDDYPEIFKKEETYRIKVSAIEFGDLDQDGIEEAVMVTTPHFRQSPTITIFHIDKNNNITRVREGFAPGKLQPVSGNFLDSHVGGFAADIEVKGKDGEPAERTKVLPALFENMGGVVE